MLAPRFKNPAPHLKAHTPNEASEWHFLVDHLEAVAELAAAFAAKFGAAEAGRLLGLTHDLAKANPAFQAYLEAAFRGEKLPTAPHSDPSALAAGPLLGPFALCAQGHHTGLPSKGDSAKRFKAVDPAAVGAAKALGNLIGLPPKIVMDGVKDRLEAEHLLRMTFSALVDADFMDTELHFDPNVQRGGFPPLTEYLEKLEERLAKFPPPSGDVDEVRALVQARCAEAADLPTGFFRLAVPTGGGKTLASLRFALRHAVAQGLDRVILAIPYVSIIDQSVGVFREIFGEENVLEHHSGRTVEDNERQDPRAVRARLATENWDHPLVVTTNVQLFEGLLANRTSRCRKLHNIARAVVVLDEVQTLPVELLEPCLSVLDWMVSHAKTSVVFCTATQPNYDSIAKAPSSLRQAHEIVGDPTPLFERLKRVDYQWAGELGHAEVAERLRGRTQGLAIFNTRKDSVEAFRVLDDRDAFYLSTLLVPHHRRKVLMEIRERLDGKLPVRVVSTQVVEAGVDVDFPYVLRVLAPLDSIVQAAGRCNRNGKMPELGVCEVFELAEGGSPGGVYASAIRVTGRFVPARLGELDAPATQADYFHALFGATVTDREVKEGGASTTVQALRRALDFPAVAKAARLIGDDTTPVVVRTYDEDRVRPILNAVEHGASPRLAARKLAPYTVNLYEHDVRKAKGERLIEDGPSGFAVWVGPYHPKLGIGGGAVMDPSDLVVM